MSEIKAMPLPEDRGQLLLRVAADSRVTPLALRFFVFYQIADPDTGPTAGLPHREALAAILGVSSDAIEEAERVLLDLRYLRKA